MKKSNFNKILKGINFQSVKFLYYDSVGYILSLLSKLVIKNYKQNFEQKIRLWNSLIWISRIIDLILFNMLGKSLLIFIKK